MRFPQKVTFTATLTMDTEGMDWEMATENVVFALLHGDLDPVRPQGFPPYSVDLVKVTRMEIVEEDE